MKNTKRWKSYKSMLYMLLATGLLSIPILLYYEMYTKVPNTIKIRAGLEQNLDFRVPASGELYREEVYREDVIETAGKAVPADSIHVDLEKPFTIVAGIAEDYKIDLKLFGMIPFKSVDLQVVQDKTLIPAGIPIGIYVKTEGVLVIGTGKFKDAAGIWQEPAVPAIQAGDYIEAINGEVLYGKKDFVSKVADCQGEEMILSIVRQNEAIDIKLRPMQNEQGEYKVGIWIRDSAQGIGTLTFIDNNGQFGALGHGINDIDTSTLMALEYGTLYNTKILSVTMGESGKPGELTGVIQYLDENILGEIEGNTAEGIFGVGNQQLEEKINQEPLPVGLKQEIKIGPAEILCTVDGETKWYDVAITKVDYAAPSVNRGILLEVTDQELLKETGGIVQGMSGSPIVQNGKIIGAVTHVLVQDSTKGYGVFIENMVESMNNVVKKGR